MNHKHTIATLAILVGIVGYWWYMIVWHTLVTDGETLKVHFLNVGSGDAILLETPNKRRVLIDAGRGIGILNELDAVLQTSSRDIDIAVMTHPDMDHIGGFIPVLKRYKIDTVIQSPISAQTAVYKKVTESVKDEGATIYTITRPHSFLLDGVQIDILWPIGTEMTETNVASVVLLITYGNTEILLTGDVPIAVEEFLINTFPKKLNDIEILKAGHHGSKTSTAQKFLIHTKPNAILYSTDKDNPYGHPHDSVLERVKQYTKVYPEQNLTDYYTADGTVSFCITPTQYTVCD